MVSRCTECGKKIKKGQFKCPKYLRNTIIKQRWMHLGCWIVVGKPKLINIKNI